MSKVGGVLSHANFRLFPRIWEEERAGEHGWESKVSVVIALRVMFEVRQKCVRTA